ncbi:hypothetical protein ACOSP7_010916 [Xanthoceras sorbifolium]
MTGALAWQVKKPNKKFMFLFSGGRWYGVDFLFYPRLSPLVRVLPLFFSASFCLPFYWLPTVWSDTKHNKFTVESQRQISSHNLIIDPASTAAAWNYLHQGTSKGSGACCI